MKAVVYDAPGSFTITEIRAPDPKPGEVRVRVQQTGICGTDLHIHNGKFFAEFPLTPGHELRSDRTVHKIIIECWQQ